MSILAFVGLLGASTLHLEYQAFDKDTKASFTASVTEYPDSLVLISENDKGLRLTAVMDRDYRLLRLEKYQDGKEKTYAVWTGSSYKVRMWGVNRDVRASKPMTDRHTVAFFLRGFPFAEGAERNYPLLVEELSAVEVNVKCLGKETVSVPAGDFSAWKLQLKGRGITNLMLLGKRFYLWYTDDSQHMLVKYRDSENRGFDLRKRWWE